MSETTVVKSNIAQISDEEKKKIPCLVVLEGSHLGEVFKIEEDSVVLGREQGCHIVILEEGVSRRHARVDCHEDSYTISDLDSTNGTFVNGSPISHSALNDGDKIQMGDVLLRFSFEDSIDVGHQENLRNLAMRDPLTKIYNRRYFMDMLNREISYAQRSNLPLTCMLFDLDHFKKINDSYGHQAGDLVLQTVAQRIAKELRIYDAFARYGGEEFAIMLRATALDNALILAERIRSIVEKLSTQVDGKDVKVTVSLGVASLQSGQFSSPDDLLRVADRYLYQAKEKGRNRICSVRNVE
ncbi:MAG: diguanylate cyclase [Bdellovibrionales bacterium]|nr:diguanylate cyclase [Bdellovibrionales bacterium]